MPAKMQKIPKNFAKYDSQKAVEFCEISGNSVYYTQKFCIPPEVEKSLLWTPYPQGVTKVLS
jgi:hypothetical protein